MERSLPAFNLTGLQAWANRDPGKVCIVSDAPDNAAANVRWKRASAEALRGDANIFFDSVGGCVVHLLHGDVTKTTKQEDIVGTCTQCIWSRSWAR